MRDKRPAVSLTANEQRIVEWIAKMRQATNVAAGVRNYRMSTEADLTLHRQGFAGELAFCKLFNTYPEFDTHARRGGYDSKCTASKSTSRRRHARPGASS